MELFLIRHADALALGERGITDDTLRPLSEKGEHQAGLVARGMQRLGFSLDKIVTSPFLRAKQTAELMLKHWTGPAPEIIESEELTPDARPKLLARFLRRLGGERVGLVGHIPHITTFASWLIGSKKAQIDMAKAGVAHISCGAEPGRGMGTLQWLVTPTWFRE